MFAIIKTGGKQYKVKEGTVIKLEKIEKGVGETIEFTDVLMLQNGDEIKVGSPVVDGAKVVAEIGEEQTEEAGESHGRGERRGGRGERRGGRGDRRGGRGGRGGRDFDRGEREDRRERRFDEDLDNIVDEEDVKNQDNLTLEDYLAQKKAKQSGLLQKAEGRKVEETKMKNVQKVEESKEKTETIVNKLKGAETYNVGATKTKDDELLGFQGGYDERGERRGGAAGGRGGRGRRGGKLYVSEQEFPTL